MGRVAAKDLVNRDCKNMTMKKENYGTMTKQQLIEQCGEKDVAIRAYTELIKSTQTEILSKNDIMSMYHCESDKALKILKVMFQMGYGNKVGKEYYISRKQQEQFIIDMAGKEVCI